jgi:hypothetical protein
MNISQAKQIPLKDLMERLGLEEAKRTDNGQEIWYTTNPLRQERTVSLSVNHVKNVWYDLGTGKGGNIIDFMMEYKKTDVSGALSGLKDVFGTHAYKNKNKPSEGNYRAKKRTSRKLSSNTIAIQKVSDLGKDWKSDSLLQYTRSRGLDDALCRQYLKYVEYKNGSYPKTFWAVGFANNAGGFELRSDKFKGASSPKDFTFITGQGSEDPSSRSVNVYEGWPDFLSNLSMKEIDAPIYDTIVLNSLSMSAKAINIIKENDYKSARLYLDNNSAGESATQKIGKELETVWIEAKDMRGLYPDYEDFNDFWIDYLNAGRTITLDPSDALKKAYKDKEGTGGKPTDPDQEYDPPF